MKFYIVVLLSLFSTPEVLANAQILPDKSLGKNSSIVGANSSNIDVITGGLKNGNSLFHSFSNFNINKGKSVYFAPKSDIKNIFTRVVGNKSSINGTLGVKGNSNLYFMNTSGIVLGNNSKIDMQGSILMSTASNISFGKDSFYSIKDLTYNFKKHSFDKPIFLEMNNAKNIEILNKPNTFLEEFFLSNTPNNKDRLGNIIGLNSGIDKDFSIIAGNINVNGGVINSYSGNINLFAVKNGKVVLIPNSYSVSPDHKNIFGKINFKNLSQINIESMNSGSLNAYAETINIESGSFIKHSNISSSNPAKPVKILLNTDNLNISSVIDIEKYSLNSPLRAGILSKATSGKGADINIHSKFVNITDGGAVATLSFNKSTAGNIKFNSKDILVDNSFKDSISISSIRSIGTDDSSVGNIMINARSLKLVDSGTISTYAIRRAKAGNIDIKLTGDLEVIGLNDFFPQFSSIIQTLSLSEEAAGNLTVSAKNITVLDGGGIGSYAALTGDTGIVDIIADTIYLSGNEENPSDIFSEVDYADPSIINLVSQLTGIDSFPFQGNASSVSVSAKNITINDEAEISVTNNGNGNAGFVKLSAQNIHLSSGAQIIAATSGGDGGFIDLNSKFLLMNGATISSSSAGDGLGGDVSISSNVIATKNGSVISADAENSQAGNIDIETDVFAANDVTLSATSEVGTNSDGEISIIQKSNELRVVEEPTTNNHSASAVTTQCTNKGKISNHGSGINPLNLSETQRKALDLKQRLEIASQFTYLDHETGERKPFKRWLGIERQEDGSLELIFSPEQSKTIQTMLSSLDNICLVKS